MAADRLYYDDCYLVNFRSAIAEVHAEGRRVYLAQTAFYPTSGGQPHDAGTLAGIPVAEVIDEGERVAHVLAEPLTVAPGTEVEGVVNRQRRFDHMQQHTGQHLLSAIAERLYGWKTLSFHLGPQLSSIEVSASTVTAEQLAAIESAVAQAVAEARPVTISYEEAGLASDLRKASERTGTLRIISIEGTDRSACGGTHVRSTAEIGPMLLRRTEKIRGNTRIEFVCGLRALRRARADYELLAQTAQLFSSPIEEVAALVKQQQSRLADSDKANQKLQNELAGRIGRELYAAAPLLPNGVRFHQLAVPSLDDSVRQQAQAFTQGARSCWLALGEQPAAVLLATSKDAGLNAGELLKTALQAVGGRGGGSATMAQGTVGDATQLAGIARQLREPIGFK